MLITHRREMTIEHKDDRSGHIWRYEVDIINLTVVIFKNDKEVKKVNEMLLPVSENWLVELREGL